MLGTRFAITVRAAALLLIEVVLLPGDTMFTDSPSCIALVLAGVFLSNAVVCPC